MALILFVFAVFILLVLFLTGKPKSLFRHSDYHLLVNFVSRRVLTEPEQVVYWRLKSVLPDKFVILCQVSFSAFLRTSGGNSRYRFLKFLHVKQKVADFVICSKDFQPLLVIELDDSSHDPVKDFIRDTYVGEAGIQTLRWHVNDIPSREEIVSLLL